MTTKLRSLYHGIQSPSNTADHIKLCDDLLKRNENTVQGQTIADLFADALAENAAFNYAHERFLTHAERANVQTVRTRVHDCLSSPQRNPITVQLESQQYRFSYLGREFSPLRHLGLGWVDYFAKTDIRPVLGEVKCNDDKNPFYAFIQLLTYLSETATENQIRRAQAHRELQIDVTFPQPFDLHILLVDHQAFKPASTKHQLIDSTRRLAEQFKQALATRHPSAAAVVGNVLCLRLNSDAFDQVSPVSLDCIWAV